MKRVIDDEMQLVRSLLCRSIFGYGQRLSLLCQGSSQAAVRTFVAQADGDLLLRHERD